MTEKQAAFYSRRSLCRMTALLTSHFAQAQLLTLRYVAGPLIPHAIIDSQYRSLMCKARRLAGGPFPYVKLTQYGPSAGQVLAYRLIADLPAEVCREIAGSWFMGGTSVEPLDVHQIASLAADLADRPEDKREKGQKSWTTSRGLAQSLGLTP